MKTLLTTLHSRYVHASLALPCLMAYCGDCCGDIRIREYTTGEPKDLVLAQIVECRADVVCFSVYLWNRIPTLELVACLKRINPQLKIVLGGPEVSFENDDFFDQHPVDALICGEGEIPLRQLLSAWAQGSIPYPVPGMRMPATRGDNGRSLLPQLDDIPSPFAAELVDLNRGLVYYESSRGCPYTCSFCMSALDEQVRSFSLERIKGDLNLLMKRRVAQIKFVDRTFNYDNSRSREIFQYILQTNQASRFHFEIGAHLLDDKTLKLLETVPPGVFQFEIGVQSTLPETLRTVGRYASLERLAENVRRLKKNTSVHLHLDLIAGLPGEDYQHFLHSIDWTCQLDAGHLQIEPVKLLPGSPLRAQAASLEMAYDPNPPYTILRSKELAFSELEKLRGIGRLVDLLLNSQRFHFLMPILITDYGRISLLLEDLDRFWRRRDLYRQSLSLRSLFMEMDGFLAEHFVDQRGMAYRELLARDYAHQERVVERAAPVFFNVDLSAQEKAAVKERVKQELDALARRGKVQFFAAAFSHLPDHEGRIILIFLYVSQLSGGALVKELLL